MRNPKYYTKRCKVRRFEGHGVNRQEIVEDRVVMFCDRPHGMSRLRAKRIRMYVPNHIKDAPRSKR